MNYNSSKVLVAGFVLLALFGLSGCSDVHINSNPSAAAEPTGFLIKTLPTSGRKYGLFVPLTYNPQQKWPVILFLHGIGEAGGDPSSCMRVGIGPAIVERQSNFPFIVIFAQSHGSWDENSDAAHDAIAALEQVKRDYSVDAGCVTLTGLSTGGYGTWAIGAQNKDKFSALVPMAAYSDSKDVDQLTDIPVWCFHNTGDPFVLAAGSHYMVSSINGRGGNAQYTELFAAGHDCWSHAYSEDQLFDWMKQQRRNSGTARRNAAPASTVTAVSTPPVKPSPVANKPVAAKPVQRSNESVAGTMVEPPASAVPMGCMTAPASGHEPPAVTPW